MIRPAFIYQTDAVRPVGQSDILFGTNEFANAREPLAQAFKAKGAPDADAFGVIVNHFKSKGDNASPAPPATGDNANDSVTGVGAFNGDRVRQAQRLVQFADDFAADRDIEAVFLAGDFNSYTKEDPIQALVDGGYELIESDQPERRVVLLPGPVRLPRPRPRQRGRDGDGHRRRHLGDQRQRVRGLPVQPLQLQRHRLLAAEPPVRRPRTTTPRSSASTSPTSPRRPTRRSRSSARTTSTVGCCPTPATPPVPRRSRPR